MTRTNFMITTIMITTREECSDEDYDKYYDDYDSNYYDVVAEG